MDEGLENVFQRHHRLAEGVRKAIKAWGLKPCARAPKWYSDTVTAIEVPPSVNAAEVIHIAYHRYNISLGAGLSKVAGKVFRIGHLGDNNEARMMAVLGTVEMAMARCGHECEARQRGCCSRGVLPQNRQEDQEVRLSQGAP